MDLAQVEVIKGAASALYGPTALGGVVSFRMLLTVLIALLVFAISAVSVPGTTGANPTPQLPITTVVTPLCDDGAISVSQLTCPS